MHKRDVNSKLGIKLNNLKNWILLEKMKVNHPQVVIERKNIKNNRKLTKKTCQLEQKEVHYSEKAH